MATNVNSVTKHFPSAQDGFTTTTASETASGAPTVELNSVAGYTDGDTVVFIIEPTSETAKQAFTGVIDTAGVQVTGVKWTSGNNQVHIAGVTVVDYETATHWSMLAKGLKVEHNEDGTHGDITADSITTDSLVINGATADGWNATGGTHSVATGYNSGNRSFEIDTSTDLTGIVSEGMRYRVNRDTTPPTQCADLEASSSQYASKSSPTGITFTDDFTCEAWINLESYAAGYIVSKYDGATGFGMSVNASGQLTAFSDSGANNYISLTYQSLPLNKWVHVVVSIDASAGTNTKCYIDGVSVPFSTSGSATSLVQAGNLQVGAVNGATFFDGKLADVRVWSDIRTATEIQDNMYGYPADTTGLVAHFKLDGDFTDSSSNGNDLTASGGALATDADNPWNATEYGIITNVTSSTIQVFCPSGYGIPNETLTAPFYSTQSAPFGFPRDKGLWELNIIQKSVIGSGSVAAGTWSAFGDLNIYLPIGAWNLGYSATLFYSTEAAGVIDGYLTLSTTTSSETDDLFTTYTHANSMASPGRLRTPMYIEGSLNIDTADNYYLLTKTAAASMNALQLYSSEKPTIIKAICAYL